MSIRSGKANRAASSSKRGAKTSPTTGLDGQDNAEQPTKRRAPRGPGFRGYRGTGGGAAQWVDAPTEWRSTSVQACGLWPYAAGSGSPMIGVPMGRNLLNGGTLCCDPISWFQRANLISNPSMFILGQPGLGKSSAVRHMVLGLSGFGVLPMVFGDLKPDYVDLVRAMGGQVIELGRGRGHLNVLDRSQADVAAASLTGTARQQVLADAHGRRLTMVGALLTILRQAPPTDREETIIDRALHLLDERHASRTPGGAIGDPSAQPVLADLLQVIQDAPEELRHVALDRGKIERYHEITELLEASLMGLAGGGRLGDLFSRPTDVPMDLSRPVVFDVSSIDDSETDLQAAALLATWSHGFGAINAAHALADAGLAPQRNYFIVMDELWRALRAGRGLVDRVDALTRLNRQRGVGMAMISHTMADLEALPDEHDRAKARGFVERAGMVMCAGLPSSEMPRLNTAVRISQAEASMLVSWSAPPSWDPQAGREAEPPGRGKFLVKVGGRPGIPFQVTLTAAEKAVHDTNKRWHPAPEPLPLTSSAAVVLPESLPAAAPPESGPSDV